MIDMKYNEIISKNKKLEKKSINEYKITVLSNIMVHQSKEICEYLLRTEGINANIYLGDYDNILQDTIKFKDSNAVIIFWELSNLIDGLQYKINLLSDSEFNALITKVKSEIDMICINLSTIPLVLFNKFSTLVFEQYTLGFTRLNELSNILNEYIVSKLTTNMKIVEIDKVVAKISIQEAVDLRFFYSSKTLYSIAFYKDYFEYVKPLFLSVNGKSKKALIFDCDNTLWKGILGEDGSDKIKMFQEIQYLAVGLAKKGIIIGLCSKNNSEDVDLVLEQHKDIILKDEHIVIKKVNWDDKASNLKAIAKELNIGLDSMVFIDDSNFEVNLIEEALPMVKVFQVPNKEYEYSMLIRKISNLFYSITETDEDINKVKMYKSQVQRGTEEQKIGNIDDYLKSLGLEIKLYIDPADKIARISQLTQKTNQFNLTTKRYTENEVEEFILDSNKSVIAIGVNDKFGDNGIVGLVILDILNKNVTIDSFLMSCRVLGRNIEYKLLDIIANFIKSKNIQTINSKYISTLKNKQVEDFFDKCGFLTIQKNENYIQYQLDIENYKYTVIDYIKVEYGK